MFIIQGDKYDIESLTCQFERQGLANAAAASRDECPCGIVVSFLQVGDGAETGHVDLGNEVGEKPKCRGEGQGTEEVGGDGVGERRHGQLGGLMRYRYGFAVVWYNKLNSVHR